MPCRNGDIGRVPKTAESMDTLTPCGAIKVIDMMSYGDADFGREKIGQTY